MTQPPHSGPPMPEQQPYDGQGFAPPPTQSAVPLAPSLAQAPARPAFVPSASPRLLEMPAYPPGYSPYIAGHIDPHAPGTVLLDVPGAAAPVYVVRTDQSSPQLWVGVGKRAGGIMTASRVSVPALDGKKLRLKWIENWSGFPVVKMGNTVLYRTPGMTGSDKAAMLVTRLAPLILGLIPGYFAGAGLAYWMAGMIKRGESPVLRTLGPAAIAAAPLVFIAALMLTLILTEPTAT